MKFDNSLVKLNISDIKKKFKCWKGMKLEIFVDSDVVIKFPECVKQVVEDSE